jgi:serine phosphatase RsbU (regulator of sigma subunit)
MNEALKLDETDFRQVETQKIREDNILIFRHYIDGQNRLNEIAESIRYAKNIQSALFVREENFTDIFPNSFYFSCPKEELTGDFAWVTKVGSRTIIAVADCTGHGIPGAMMSILGMSLLNQVVLEERCYEPSFILRRVDLKMQTTFKTNSDSRSGFDGMDIAVCCIDSASQEITFAGAMRPLWIVQQNKLRSLSASRYPIGGMRMENQRLFPQSTISYTAGDMIYMFTDGYADQFGGAKNKKIQRGRLRTLIQLISSYTARQQKEQLLEFFHVWKAHSPQTDDATFVGIRL